MEKQSKEVPERDKEEVPSEEDESWRVTQVMESGVG